jgi:hypothetical protein
MKELTSTEKGIYQTPEGELFERETKVGYGVAVTEDRNITREKKKRGESRFYSVEDEEWERKLRQELEQKKKDTSAEPTPEQKQREEKLKKEKLVRDRVTHILNHCSFPLKVHLPHLHLSFSLSFAELIAGDCVDG